MALVISADEALVVDSVRCLLSRSSPVSAFRVLRDGGDPRRYDPALWSEVVAAGFGAPQLSEALGGFGMGYVTAGLVAEEMGRTLAATPFHSTALAIELLVGAGATDSLPALVAGERIIAFALDETRRHDPARIDAFAERHGAGFRLSGAKRFVVDGAIAHELIVAARTDAGESLLRVPIAAEGVTVTELALVDSRSAADIRFESVLLDAGALLGDPGRVQPVVDRALDVGRALLAAELLGIAQEAFDRTVAYLKDREQFGVKIGSFQALQHRASRLFMGLQIARSVVLKALRALDEGDQAASALASLAKANLTETARLVLNEAMQMHGGIGVTDDLDIGLFFKRARVLGDWLGDDYFHKERLARIVWNI